MNLLKRKTTQNIRYGEPKSKVFVQIKLLLVLLCAGIGYWIYASWPMWLEKLDQRPLNTYALAGQTAFTTNDDIREVLIKMGDLKGFFTQDVAIIREQIETLPWVKGAVVRKIWPNRLSIWLLEYEPVAVWNKTDFITQDGTIFQLPPEKLKNHDLPYLAGPDYQSVKVLDAWKRIYADFKAKNLIVKGIGIDTRGAWQATLSDDVVLKLGRGEWKSKLDRFVTIYPQIEVPINKKIEYVDLRYPMGAAVSIVDK